MEESGSTSFKEYQSRLGSEASMIAERLNAKRIIRKNEIDVQWNGHGFVYYPPDWPLKTIRCFYEDIPPGGHNVEHKHVQEAVTYIVSGHGHAFIGGSRDDERATAVGVRLDWEIGDFLMVPSNIWHVFYNDDQDGWARFMGITSPLFKSLGLMSTKHHGNEGRSVLPPDDIAKAARR